MEDKQGTTAPKQRRYCTTFEKVNAYIDWATDPMHPDGDNPKEHTVWELLSTQAILWPDPDEPGLPDLMLVWSWGSL